MTYEKLRKATELTRKIESINTDIEGIERIKNSSAHMSVGLMGFGSIVKVEALRGVILPIVEAHFKSKLQEAQKEFEEL